MANAEHLAKLGEGVAAWNAWYEEEAPRSKPDLSGADLRGHDLSAYQLIEADLSGADLREATLFGTHLDYANLANAQLDGAKLSKARLFFADLTGCSITGADLSGARIVGAKLHNADLTHATLDDAFLEVVEALHANLSGACLRHAHIKNGRWYWTSMAGADLSHARFEEVWLEGVDFSGGNLTAVHLDRCEVKRCAFRHGRLADAVPFRTRFEAADLADSDARGAQFHDCSFPDARLTRARFEDAEFIDCSDLAFDHNRIANTRLSAARPEAWQHLRRRYTVARLGAHLLLLLVAFLPAISRVNGLVALETGRQVATAALQDIENTFAGGGDAELVQLEQFSAELRTRLEPGGHPSTTRPLYYILLGFDRDYLFAATALLLLLYNVMRLWLTWNVSVLRDEGARTGRTPYRTLRAAEAAHRGEEERVAAGIAAAGGGHLPPREDLPPLIRWLRYHNEAYGWMLGPDRFVTPFFWLAVAGVAITLVRFLFQPIAIPGLG